MTTVHVPPSLRKLTDNQATLETRAGTLREVLEVCFERFPALRSKLLTDAGTMQRYVRIFEGERDVSLDSPLSQGAQVRILTALAGG